MAVPGAKSFPQGVGVATHACLDEAVLLYVKDLVCMTQKGGRFGFN